MKRWRDQGGFSMLEMLVSITVLMMAGAGMASLLIHNSRVNKSQQLASEVQANARNTMSMIVQKLRTSGWDPFLTGVPDTDTDSDSADALDFVEIYCDFDGDGNTDAPDEQVMIRHDSASNQVAWRLQAGGAFSVLAINISNDEDGDGNAERMFTPLPTAVNPSTIRVKLTAQSPVPDPITGDVIRYTMTSDVLIRKSI